MSDGAAPDVPLSRNRNYHILWSGQLFSEFASELILIAFPLLILSMAGSPLQMGVASSVLAVATMSAAAPAGVLADRWDRRKIMLICQALRALAVSSLALALYLDSYTFAHLLAVAVLEGVLGSVFQPAEQAALPSVVPASQLSAAVARNAARPFLAMLLGPIVAGYLFALHPISPFLADAVILTISFGTMLFLRLPRTADAGRDAVAEPPAGFRGQFTEGLRWVLRNRVIRTTMAWAVVANMVFSALLIIILAMSEQDGVGAGQIGLMMACFGAGGILGAIAAGWLHDAVKPSVVVIGFSWILTVAVALMTVVPTGVPLGALLGAAAFFAPVANTVVLTYQITTTPDELRGRLSGLVALASGAAAALGPLIGAFLLGGLGDGRKAVLVCAGGLLLVALASTASPVLRRFPAVKALEEEPVSA
ncbi:MFS transporter [Lentzea pudingi]|uniref:MFS transporter n=1 Tax=Lentzea pudingi TaxID=1789439 RepID=A0ABQ2I8U5_9PSEU|nr:MFS transporter [Lentzea pudingi]GGN03895.1 MFS transporter [Lentzea pudingi]